MKTPVVLVDDHLSLRQMLIRVLEADGTFEVVGHAGSGVEGLKLCRQLQPKVIILDLMLPELSGVELLTTLREERRDARFLVYSGTLNQSLVLSALRARPHGFVHKEDSLTTLMDALRAVANGGTYLTSFATQLAESIGSCESPLDRLSNREREVLQLVAEGCSSKAIASRLSIANKTVEHHRTSLMQKLGLHDIASLTRLAVREGLVRVE
jgi:DNA-binding NarL/FixJ family response regulator